MPISLSELSPFITRAQPAPADYSSVTDAQLQMNAQELTRRNIEGDQAAKMAQLAQQRQLEQMKEQGRGSRAGQRMDFNREKFGFEQQKYGQAQTRLGDADLNSALDAFNKAVESGDQGGIDYWRQRLQMLQGTQVREDDQGPLASVNQDGHQSPEQAQALNPQTERQAELSTSLNGPRITAPKQETGLQPGEVATPLSPEEQQMGAEWQQSIDAGPPPAKWLEDEMLMRGEGQLQESSAGQQSAGFSKSLTPRIAPEPMKLEESQEGSAANAPRQPFVKGGNDQGAPEPYIPSPPNSPQAQAPNSPPAAPPPAPPPAPPQQRFTVSRGGKDIMSLNRGIGPTPSIEADFAPLIANARTPDEQRAAKIALETAKAVAQKEGIEKGRLAGKQAYDFELNNARKTRIGTGKGIGEEGFGGTGLSKAEYGVSEDQGDHFQAVVNDIKTRYQLPKMHAALRAVGGMKAQLSTANGVADRNAVRQWIRTTDDRISDSDFKSTMQGGGAWEQLNTLLKQYTDSGRLSPGYLKQLRDAASGMEAEIRNQQGRAAEDAANIGRTHPWFRNADTEDIANRLRANVLGEGLPAGSGGGKTKPRPGGSTGVAKKFGL